MKTMIEKRNKQLQELPPMENWKKKEVTAGRPSKKRKKKEACVSRSTTGEKNEIQYFQKKDMFAMARGTRNEIL